MTKRRTTEFTWMVALVAAMVLSAFFPACSSDTANPVVPSGGGDGGTDGALVQPGPVGPQAMPVKGAGFTCEVKKLLTVKCQTCHSDPPVGGALVPLMTVEQMLAWSPTQPNKTVAQVALERMQDPDRPMPPKDFNNPATPDEAQAFEAWMQANFVGSCVGAAPPNATCTTCHGDSTRVVGAGMDPSLPFSPPHGTNGETLTSQAAVGAHQAHLTKSDLSSGPLQCNDCHVLPSSTSHANGVVDFAWGPLAKAAGANPDYNGATCTNVYCHGAFPGGRTVFAPAWTGGAMSCGSCHGTPPPTPPHSNPAAECSTCHGAGYSQTAKTVNKATHINGVVDVNYAGATCTSCHGDATRVGIAGADAQVKSSPALGSKGETAATQRAVGVHQAHVNQATWAANPLQCANCHVVPTATSHSNGVVDMSFTGLASVAGAKPAWNGTTCANVYCHGAFTGGTTNAAPSWTTPGSVTCGSCHALPPATPEHNGATGECSTCHGAGYSQTAKTVNKTRHMNGSVETDTTGQTCTSCHGDAARVAIAGADVNLKSSPPLGTKGETLTSQAAVGAHVAHLNKGTFSAPVACTECHVVPITTAVSGLHRNGVDDIAFGALSKTGGVTPVWNGTTCTASYCHGNFTGGNTAAAPNWTTAGTLACNSCHGLPPTTPAHSNPALACSTCHDAGYSATSQTVNKTLHINGVVDVNTAGLTCQSCHGDNTRVAIAGADPALKSSPQLGTKGETLTSTRAVGMHQGHLNTGTYTSPTACAECHVVPITTSHSNGKVDMSFGTLSKTGGVTPAWSGTSCTASYCHGNFTGGNTAAAPAWTSGTVSCTGSCHGDPPATPAHSNTALACSVCHGANYSNAAVNKPTHINGVVDVDQSGLTCTTCHGTASRIGIAGADAKQAAAPPVGVKGETATSSLAVGAHQAHLNKIDLTATPIQCNACHAVPSSNLHSDGVIQVTFGTMAKTGGAAPSWNGSGCAATYCHGNFPSGLTTAVPSWTDGPMTCTSCHTQPGSEHNRSQHLQAACGDCHAAGYTSSVLVKNLHINGVKDVAGPKITTYTASTKSCTPTCHGRETWR